MVHGWMRRISKRLVSRRRKKGRHQPFYGTWVADFMLRQDAGRPGFMLGKYLSNKKIPWQRRRKLEMAAAGNKPTASFLTKIGKMQSVGCRLCRIAQEAQVGALTVWRMKHIVTSSVQAAKE